MDGLLHSVLPVDTSYATNPHWNNASVPLGAIFPEWKPEISAASGSVVDDDVIGSSFRMHHLLMPHQNTNSVTGSSLLQHQSLDQRKFNDVTNGTERESFVLHRHHQQQQQQQQSSSILIPDSTTTLARDIKGDNDDDSGRDAILFTSVAATSTAGNHRRQSSCGSVMTDSLSGKTHNSTWLTMPSSTALAYAHGETRAAQRFVNSADDDSGKRTDTK